VELDRTAGPFWPVWPVCEKRAATNTNATQNLPVEKLFIRFDAIEQGTRTL